MNARALVIDSDDARATAGLGRGPSQSQRRDIQRKLLDRLEATAHPQLVFRTASVRRSDLRALSVQGDLTIRGVTRRVMVPVMVESAGADGVRMSGTVTVRQSEFGVHPESVAGVVNVADAVDLHFLLNATPTGRPCPAPGGAETAVSRG